MQTKKFNIKSDFFGHGSIIKIKDIKFKDSKGAQYKFSDFYPHADLKGIDFAIICTQDCDIDQKKISHVNLALLEPINRSKKENPIPFLDLDASDLSIQFDSMNFYSSATMGKPLTQKITSMLDNTNAHNLFLDVSGKYYFANLAKMYPIKFEHFGDLKKLARFQLKGSFKHLLGWKIANLYGRVGVAEYAQNTRDTITKKIISLIGSSITATWPKKSYELQDAELAILKSLIGQYDGAFKKGKDTKAHAAKIYEKLAELKIVKSTGT